MGEVDASGGRKKEAKHRATTRWCSFSLAFLSLSFSLFSKTHVLTSSWPARALSRGQSGRGRRCLLLSVIGTETKTEIEHQTAGGKENKGKKKPMPLSLSHLSRLSSALRGHDAATPSVSSEPECKDIRHLHAHRRRRLARACPWARRGCDWPGALQSGGRCRRQRLQRLCF